ncbi:MAG: hypothetical protein SPD11_01125 [Sphaerochaetaceae bacterium]|nr:hypothetical protein [Sphaerochaetaceae bacterium]
MLRLFPLDGGMAGLSFSAACKNILKRAGYPMAALAGMEIFLFAGFASCGAMNSMVSGMSRLDGR